MLGIEKHPDLVAGSLLNLQRSVPELLDSGAITIRVGNILGGALDRQLDDVCSREAWTHTGLFTIACFTACPRRRCATPEHTAAVRDRYCELLPQVRGMLPAQGGSPAVRSCRKLPAT